MSSLLFTAGMTPRLGKVAEGITVTDWDEEEIARKIIDSDRPGLRRMAGAAGRRPKRLKINFLDTPGYSTFINDTQSFADRRRRRADPGGRRGGRAGGHRKSLGLRHRIRSAARLRHQLDGPRTGELRARAGIGRSRCSAAAWCRCNCRSARRKSFGAWWIWSP